MANSRCLSVLTPVVLLFLSVSLLPCMPAAVAAESANPQAAQWKELGGHQLLAGKYELKETWTSSSDSRSKERYWKGSYYLAEEKRQYAPWENTVKNDVAPDKGRITVKGPGVVVAFTKREGASLVLRNAETKARFIPTCHDIYRIGTKWHTGWPGKRPTPEGTALDVGQFLYGRIPADEEVTLNVSVEAVSYNNTMNTGEFAYHAPQGLEFEIWWFPFEGGEVIKVIKIGPDGKEIDITGNLSGGIETPDGPNIEPIPGQIVGVVNEPTLPPNQPITGVQGELKDIPEDIKRLYVKTVYGDVHIDHGGLGTKRLQAGESVIVGNVIVTGDGSCVDLSPSRECPADVFIDGNSRVTIADSGKFFPDGKLRPKKGFVKTCLSLILDSGAAVIHKTTKEIMVLFGLWDAEKAPDPSDPDYIRHIPLVCVGVHGSTVRVTHDKSSGDRSIAVVAGEAIVTCNLKPEMELSVKAGEKLVIDKNCNWRKSNLTASEIEYIKSVVPNLKDTTSFAPVADSHVYAYGYQHWNKCNWGAYDVLGAGWHPAGGEKRAYLRFDLSGVDPKKVNKAVLRLFHYHTAGSPTLTLGVHRVTGTWNEGRGTYHSGRTESSAAPGEVAWVAQPPFDNVVVASFSPGAGTNKYVEVDVTELVKGWLSGQPNYGLVITADGALGPSARESVYVFYSREREDATKRPVLLLQSTGGTGDPDAPDAPEVPDTPNVPDAPDVPDMPDAPDVPEAPDVLKAPDVSDNGLRVRAEDRRVTPDTSVTIPVWLEFPKVFPRTRDGRVNVANLNVEIAYDPQVVKPAANVIAGNLLSGALFQANAAKAGVIKIGFATKGRVQTTGTLAQITFQVVGQPGQRSPLNVEITAVNDDAGGTPAATAIDGAIQIVKAAVPGDINGNGIVDAGDALAALKMSVELMKEDLILNVDKQNGVTSNDARLLLKMAVQGNATPSGNVGSGSGTTTTSPAATANSSTVGGSIGSPPSQASKSVSARNAYQEYIAAYNRMTSLMAAGKGDTPEARKAHEEYLKAKAKYDAMPVERPEDTR